MLYQALEGVLKVKSYQEHPVIQRPHLHYTGFYRRVASWNALCQIGQSFTLYRIVLQQYGVTFISPTEKSVFPSICGASPTG